MAKSNVVGARLGLASCVLLLGATLLSSPAKADPVAAILAEAEQTCTEWDGGRFSQGDAVVELDLTGDGAADRLVDASRFACAPHPSMWCGSGGCTLHAVVGSRSWRFQAEGWRLVDWDGRPILLIARDGGWCGGAGAQLCYEAVVWSGGEMLTVMPRP
ncbi:MAG: hypothetical protein ACFBRM_14835 [Pikeienuella sp.]